MQAKKYEVQAAMTFDEIGLEMGISHQRASQLCNKALKKCEAILLQRFGTSVKLEDIFQQLDKENIYEQMSCM